MAAESQPQRKFPLIFCLHGAHNPIKLTESYGVMQVAAREECIVIAPENENWENIQALLDYARLRLSKCPHGDSKPFCSSRAIHCYRPDRKEQIRQVMRYAGPRMLLHHPVIAIRHVMEMRREKGRQAHAG